MSQSANTKDTSAYAIKTGLAKMLKGGVIMDVTNASEAEIAQKAGACAVMALHKVPADIVRDGGIARMADPIIIQGIQKAVSIPVMAKVRIGHFAEAQILQQLNLDFIDESEVLTPASTTYILKHEFTTPFVCGCRNLREALRAISKGAAMIRTKGNAGTGNVAEAVRHLTEIKQEIASLAVASPANRAEWAKEAEVPLELLEETLKLQRLPVVTFAAGGIATPADAALMMQLGSDGIFVGSGIFKSKNPLKMAKAIVSATTNFANAAMLAEAATDVGEPMR